MACLGTEAVHVADAFVSITYLRSDDCTFSVCSSTYLRSDDCTFCVCSSTYLRSDDCTFCQITFDFCTTTIEVESEEVHVVHLLTVRI